MEALESEGNCDAFPHSLVPSCFLAMQGFTRAQEIQNSWELEANLIQVRFPCDLKNRWQFSAERNSTLVEARKGNTSKGIKFFPKTFHRDEPFHLNSPGNYRKFQSKESAPGDIRPSSTSLPLGWGGEGPWEGVFTQRMLIPLFLQQKENIIRTQGTLNNNTSGYLPLSTRSNTF